MPLQSRIWDRFGHHASRLFREYGVDPQRWTRLITPETLTEAVAWVGPGDVYQALDLPDAEAPEREWHEFFVLLEIRLKLMPRAA